MPVESRNALERRADNRSISLYSSCSAFGLTRNRQLRPAVLNTSLPLQYPGRTADTTATGGKQRDFWKGFKASRASACSLPRKQAFVSEGNTEYQPGPHTTRLARGSPTTTLAGTR